MYKIRFDFQTESGIPDSESCSIVLTKEQYEQLPKLSIRGFRNDCVIHKKDFYEQVRNPKVHFPALWIFNDSWKLKNPEEYIDSSICMVFVCLDMNEDIWIAFKYYNLATIEDAYDSTVSVSYPAHGDVYALDEKSKEIIKQFF